MIGDEDQLLNKIVSVPVKLFFFSIFILFDFIILQENVEFVIQAEELFRALDNSIQNFHLINQQKNKLYELFHLYCQNAPKSIHLNIEICLNAFNQALYSTLRTILNSSGSVINAEIQFAWRCFTNDLSTTDILGFYATKRPSRYSARAGGNTGGGPISKKGGGGRDKSSDDKINSKQQSLDLEDSSSDWLTRELNIDEIDAIESIQKIARGFLQRRINFARKSGTEKNLLIQRTLQSTMSLLKIDSNKTALLLFK